MHLAVDALLLVVNAVRQKAMKMAVPAVIFGVIMAVVSIVLGALCIAKGNGGDTIIPGNVQLIIFGIVVLVYAIFMGLSTFVVLPAATVVISKTIQADAPIEGEVDHE